MYVSSYPLSIFPQPNLRLRRTTLARLYNPMTSLGHSHDLDAGLHGYWYPRPLDIV